MSPSATTPAPTDTTSLRGRVAARSTGSAVEKPAAGPPPVAVLVREAIERQSDAFRSVLPSVVDPDRFARLVLTAVKGTPKLLECWGTPAGETSVLLAAMQAASVGLEPNTPLQDCWLLPRKRGDVTECQLSIGYRGLLKLARRSGTISTIFAEVVYDADEFEYGRDLERDTLRYRPFEGPAEERGDLRYAFAVVRYKDGGNNFVVLPRGAVEARRAMSDSWKYEKGRQYSPWARWPEAMWRKSALRALAPFLDLSPEAATALAVDEAPRLALGDDGTIEATYAVDDVPALPAGVDATTGEVAE